MPTFGLPIRIRKLIGLVVLLTYIFLYAMLVMTVAVYRLPDNTAAEVAYYLVAGIVWAIPAKYLLQWMQTPDPDDGTA